MSNKEKIQSDIKIGRNKWVVEHNIENDTISAMMNSKVICIWHPDGSMETVNAAVIPVEVMCMVEDHACAAEQANSENQALN
jgi:hypothetical protein